METVQTTPETAPPLEVIEEYLRAIEGTDIAEYERVEGITNNVLFDNSGPSQTSECDTYRVIREAKIYELEPTLERAKLLNSAKTFSAVHIVRGMIQGKQVPVEDFGPVIDAVMGSINRINGFPPDKKAKHLLRREIRNVWSFKSLADPEYMRRTAEAYKIVGRPFTLGEALIKLSGIRFTQY